MPLPSIRACALALLAAVAACACTRDQAEPSLRVYEVPPSRTEALGMALNDVFLATDHKASVGKASSRIPGQLLVLAPESLHASIDETLGQLVADVAEGGGAANAQLRFWVLDAAPGPTEDSPGDVPQPVLAALQRQFPGHAFRLYDRARLGIAGRNGNAHLQTAKQTAIQVKVWKEGNGLLGDIEILTRHASGHAPLQTTIALPMGEYVVLAVTGPAEGEASAPQRVFVVQATSS